MDDPAFALHLAGDFEEASLHHLAAELCECGFPDDDV